MILFFLDAAPALFLVFKKGGGLTRGKNLKDDVGLLLVGYVFSKSYFEF